MKKIIIAFYIILSANVVLACGNFSGTFMCGNGQTSMTQKSCDVIHESYTILGEFIEFDKMIDGKDRTNVYPDATITISHHWEDEKLVMKQHIKYRNIIQDDTYTESILSDGSLLEVGQGTYTDTNGTHESNSSILCKKIK